jgi:hypothetical protein
MLLLTVTALWNAGTICLFEAFFGHPFTRNILGMLAVDPDVAKMMAVVALVRGLV